MSGELPTTRAQPKVVQALRFLAIQDGSLGLTSQSLLRTRLQISQSQFNTELRCLSVRVGRLRRQKTPRSPRILHLPSNKVWPIAAAAKQSANLRANSLALSRLKP